jgi:hypothetical protein
MNGYWPSNYSNDCEMFENSNTVTTAQIANSHCRRERQSTVYSKLTCGEISIKVSIDKAELKKAISVMRAQKEAPKAL